MPFRLWPERSKHAQLEKRVRSLEKTKNHYVTGPQVWDFWKSRAAADSLPARVGDLEKWREDSEVEIEKLAKDVAIIERKLNELLPVDNGGEDTKSERPVATRNSDASHETCSHNNLEPHAAFSELAPEELPVTFTRCKPDSTGRTSLDVTSLRLP